jgi:glycosyltransferase involved in cell wall biosynthesis
MDMRILFLHEVNYLEKPIFEMHEFPEYLALRGHQVAFVHFPEGWEKHRTQEQGFRSTTSGRAAKEASLILYTPQSAAGSFLGRVKTALSFRSTFRKVLNDFRPEVVVSFSVPTSGWQALIESRRVGIPFVFRALDVSHKIRKGVFSFLVYLAEKFVYRNSTRVSANNPAMADYCQSLGARSERVTVELPPLDLDHFAEAKSFRSDYRAKLGLSENDKVITYMGSFFYFSGLPELLGEFAKAKQVGTKLLLIGGGEQESDLRRLSELLGLTCSVIFTGFVSFDELPKYLAVADVAVNSMHRTLVSNAAFPSKVIQYMASGLPVVSTDLAGLRKTFGETRGLRLVPTPQQVIGEAMALIENSNLEEIGRRNQSEVAKIFSKEGAVATFEEQLLGLAGEL